MRALALALSIFFAPLAAAAAESAPRVGAVLFSTDIRLAEEPLGDYGVDAGFGIEGVLTRYRPLCAGLRLSADPDSESNGSSGVRSLDVPLFARIGVCVPIRYALLHTWMGGGIAYISVTTEVAGVSRQDSTWLGLYGGGVELIARFRFIAVLVGLSGELSGDETAAVLRLGLGAWG